MPVRQHSLETRQKIKANHKDVAGENNPFYGRKHSTETKEKIANSKRGKIWIYHPLTLDTKLIARDQLENVWGRVGWKLGRG